MCDWVTFLYSRKLTEHYKPAVMGKNENHLKKLNSNMFLASTSFQAVLSAEDISIQQNTVEYYSAIKKNEIMPFTATWMELETVILSEVSQKEKDKYHYDITYVWNLI